MAKEDPPSRGETRDPYAHPPELVEKMMRALSNEDVTNARSRPQF
jgi:hypothetical protein